MPFLISSLLLVQYSQLGLVCAFAEKIKTATNDKLSKNIFFHFN